jgi:hypothetical protein
MSGIKFSIVAANHAGQLNMPYDGSILVLLPYIPATIICIPTINRATAMTKAANATPTAGDTNINKLKAISNAPTPIRNPLVTPTDRRSLFRNSSTATW